MQAKGTQMAMFMTPNEMIAGSVTHANDVYGPDGKPAPLTHEMIANHPRWKEKKRTIERPDGIGKSVAAEGVHEPLNIYHDTSGAKANRGLSRDDPRGMLRNGHHRFLSQYYADPDRLMPVVHEGDI
jgi:hypothetical protein